MLKCDYCCCRPSSLTINCLKCSSSRSINICFKCSLNVNQLKEHAKHHPLSTYKLNDIPLDENNINEWLSNDEINLIEIIESCGLGNWNDIGLKMSKNPLDCKNHFENIYLSGLKSPYSIYFQSFQNQKKIFGENSINDIYFKLKYLIYPPMLIDNEQQKLLTYMPYRDEYEREYLNQAENRLPLLNNDYQQEQFQQIEQTSDQQKDGSTILLHKAKLSLLRSYAQILRRRLQLKDFIRDYALGFNYSPDKQMDLHQISRFLSADQYERLIFNHRRIRNLLEELGCSTNSNQDNDQSQSKKKSSKSNNEKRRPRTLSNINDESSSSSISDNQSNISLSSSSSSSSSSRSTSSEKTSIRSSSRSYSSSSLSRSSSQSSSSSSISSRKSSSSSSSLNSHNKQINTNLRRRSVRRVSSSSTNTSIKTTNIKERLYTRRRINQSDNNNTSQRLTRSTGNVQLTSDISLDSTDDEINLSEYNQSNVASRTRSHTPPIHHSDKKRTKNSQNGKKLNNHLNGSLKRNLTDVYDQNSSKYLSNSNSKSKPKINRMLTRHQLVVQQTSPNKKRKINSNSNSIDDQNYSIN